MKKYNWFILKSYLIRRWWYPAYFHDCLVTINISFNYKMNKFKTNFILIISACYSITLMCYSIIFRCSSIIFGHQLQYNHYDIVFRFQVLWHHFRDFWHRFQVLLNSVKYLHGLHLLLSNQNAVIVLRSI